MRDQVWWKQLHWPEYGAELFGTAFLVFAGVSAVVFVFGTGTPLAQILPDTSTRRHFATREAQWWAYQSCRIAGVLGAREDASS